MEMEAATFLKMPTFHPLSAGAIESLIWLSQFFWVLLSQGQFILAEIGLRSQKRRNIQMRHRDGDLVFFSVVSRPVHLTSQVIIRILHSRNFSPRRILSLDNHTLWCSA